MEGVLLVEDPRMCWGMEPRLQRKAESFGDMHSFARLSRSSSVGDMGDYSDTGDYSDPGDYSDMGLDGVHYCSDLNLDRRRNIYEVDQSMDQQAYQREECVNQRLRDRNLYHSYQDYPEFELNSDHDCTESPGSRDSPERMLNSPACTFSGGPNELIEDDDQFDFYPAVLKNELSGSAREQGFEDRTTLQGEGGYTTLEGTTKLCETFENFPPLLKSNVSQDPFDRVAYNKGLLRDLFTKWVDINDPLDTSLAESLYLENAVFENPVSSVKGRQAIIDQRHAIRAFCRAHSHRVKCIASSPHLVQICWTQHVNFPNIVSLPSVILHTCGFKPSLWLFLMRFYRKSVTKTSFKRVDGKSSGECKIRRGSGDSASESSWKEHAESQIFAEASELPAADTGSTHLGSFETSTPGGLIENSYLGGNYYTPRGTRKSDLKSKKGLQLGVTTFLEIDTATGKIKTHRDQWDLRQAAKQFFPEALLTALKQAFCLCRKFRKPQKRNNRKFGTNMIVI